jgi:tripartite-type tricarboxylate transporter receptor subunit TctC
MILRRARRAFLAAVLSLCAISLCATTAAHAQSDYPNRQIRLMVGFAAGGPVDVTARIVADALSGELGKPVVVDNHAGAGGNLAADAVAKAPPDGYTLLQSSNAIAIAPGIYGSLPFDVVKDFAPVTEVTTSFLVMVVHPSVPANTLPEFIAYAKAKAGKIDYASSGAGTITHLAGAMFGRDAGLAMQHVPYRGSAPAITDLVAGRVPVMFAPTGLAKPFIESGKLRAIAVTGLQRADNLPGVPTIDEQGLRGFEATSWGGMFAPAATPKPVIDRLHGAVVNILANDETRRRLLQQEALPRGTDPETFRRFVATDVARWIQVARETGTKAE